MRRGPDRRNLLAAAGLTIAGLGATAQAQAPGAAVVQTTAGAVRGYEHGGVRIFKGVPYAASTAGANRWRAPKPPGPWRGVRDVVTFGDRSPQLFAFPPNMLEEAIALGQEAMSEDCLSLNVWTPAADTAKRPVMLWLHGGNYTLGSGSGVRYDGVNLASKQDVVVVTVNHRLNAFGFLHLTGLDSARYPVGNVGLLDCVAALQWVRDNIARFGGDPGCVTLFGQSGGAGKVSTLMAMPAAKGLFHRAVAQSGVALRHQSVDAATATTRRLMAQLGVADLPALEAVPVARLLAAMQALSPPGVFAPVVDGVTLAGHPFDSDAHKQSAAVPLLLGSTLTETTFFRTTPLEPIDARELLQQVSRYTGLRQDQAARLIELYRAQLPGEDEVGLFQRLSTDWFLTADVARQAERKASLGVAPAYVYRFDKTAAARGGKLRAPHTQEIAYVFDNLALADPLVGPVTAPMQALADRTSTLWARFARTGRPSAPGVAAWPAYDIAGRAVMVIDDDTRVVHDPGPALRTAIAALKAQPGGG